MPLFCAAAPKPRHPQTAGRTAQALATAMAAGLPLALSGGAVLALPNPYPGPYPQPNPQPMPGQTLLFPAAGVVCDQPAQLCYNNGGLSALLSGRYLGPGAERNAERRLQGHLPGPVFQLSNGSRCDVRRMVCWSNGAGQATIDRQLTSQLFGATPAPTPTPTPYPTPYPTPTPAPTPSGQTGFCQLTRSGATLFRGPCALNEVRQGFQPRFDVVLQNGSRFVFERGQNGYLISDGSGGRWPVQVQGNGNRGFFHWADTTLAVTQNNYRPDSNQRWGRAIGTLLMDLFN